MAGVLPRDTSLAAGFAFVTYLAALALRRARSIAGRPYLAFSCWESVLAFTCLERQSWSQFEAGLPVSSSSILVRGGCDDAI